MFRCCLRHEEHALDVQVHDVIPVLLAEVDRVFTTDQTCVVNQNVDFTELSNRTLQQLRDGVDFTQVSGQAQETTAQRGHTLNGLLRLNDVDPDDITASFRQTQCHALAQTGITTGDDRNFTLQRKCIQNHFLSFIFQRLNEQASLCLTVRD